MTMPEPIGWISVRDRMREERGEHLSHCYLFDLNVARSGAGEKR